MTSRTILRAPRDANLSVPQLPPSSAAPRSAADVQPQTPKPFSELEECRRTRADIEKGVARCEAALAAQPKATKRAHLRLRHALTAERARLRRFDRLVALQERLERAEARLARAATCTCGLRVACEAAARARVARAKLALSQLGLRNFQIAIAETRQMLEPADSEVEVEIDVAAVELQLKALLAILPNVEGRLKAAQKEVAELVELV